MANAVVKDIVHIMEDIAPLNLAEDWDNVGLLVGDFDAHVERILVSLDVTEATVLEAVEKGAQLIISHHPVIFSSIKSIGYNTSQGKILKLLMQNNISVYCAHTNLDKCVGGVDDTLSGKLGMQNIKPLTVQNCPQYYKLAVYIPKGYEDIVADAILNAGAGFIGNYSRCTFKTGGIGTFKPLKGTHPFIGREGEIEKTDEIRLETIVPISNADRVVKAMLSVHPYEEVAYDLYPIVNGMNVPSIGRIGRLPGKIILSEYIKRIKEALDVDYVQLIGDSQREVQIVASCAGAGGDFVKLAQNSGADVFITGEIKYHEAQDSLGFNIPILAAGHFNTEYLALPVLIDRLQKAIDGLQYKVGTLLSTNQKAAYIVL